MNDNVFDLKPLPEKTFQSLLRDNASDLWDVAEECIVAPSEILENELLEILCRTDTGFVTQALWIGAECSELEEHLLSFAKANPSHPLALHVDKSLRGYLQLVIEKEEATISEANAAEEESYRQEYGRDEPPWGEEQ